jgi:MYXO-CTERM domain-containing protein
MWHHNGDLADGFPVMLFVEGDEEHDRTLSSPAIGDVDGDGSPDIVLGTNQNVQEMGPVYAIHADGNDHAGGPFLENFPIKILSIETLPLVGEGIFSSPALADVDGDGDMEIAIAGNAGPPRVFDADGYMVRAMENGVAGDPIRDYGPMSDSQDKPLQVIFTNPAFGDLNNDGRLDLMQGAGGLAVAAAFASGGTRINFDHLMGAWDLRSGRFLYAYPRRIDDWQFFQAPAVADLDGDGWPEVIQGSAGYYMHAWNRMGQEPPGWPKFTGGWIVTAPAVGDVNGDGNLDVITATRNGWLFAWSTTGPDTGRVEWESFKHDNRNTGNYHTPLDQGTLEVQRNPDLDGDGVPNDQDGDMDGDGVYNQDDDDTDGDGVPNDYDFDDDEDGIPDESDETPTGPEGAPDDDGCGCSAGATSDAGLPLVLLLGWLLIVWRRRRLSL